MSTEKKVTSNEQKVTSNEQKVTSNEKKVTSNEQKVTSNEQIVTSNEQKLTSSEQKLTSNEQIAKSFTSLHGFNIPRSFSATFLHFPYAVIPSGLSVFIWYDLLIRSFICYENFSLMSISCYCISISV